MDFEEIEHTADRAFRVRGRSLAKLLENAAYAMGALDGLGPAGNLLKRSLYFSCSSVEETKISSTVVPKRKRD